MNGHSPVPLREAVAGEGALLSGSSCHEPSDRTAPLLCCNPAKKNGQNVAQDGSQRNFQVSTLLKKSFLPFLYDQSAPAEFEQANMKEHFGFGGEGVGSKTLHFVQTRPLKPGSWLAPVMSTTENTSFRPKTPLSFFSILPLALTPHRFGRRLPSLLPMKL